MVRRLRPEAQTEVRSEQAELALVAQLLGLARQSQQRPVVDQRLRPEEQLAPTEYWSWQAEFELAPVGRRPGPARQSQQRLAVDRRLRPEEQLVLLRSSLGLCGNLSSGLLGTGGYDLRGSLCRLGTGRGRLSLSLCLLGGGLGLRGNLSSGLLWTGGYDLRCCLGWLSTGMSRLSLRLRLLGSCLGLRGNLSSGLLGTGGYDLWCLVAQQPGPVRQSQQRLAGDRRLRPEGQLVPTGYWS